MRNKKKFVRLTILLGLPVLLIILFVSVVFGGYYNVGATSGHSKPVEWILRTTMENSVRHHAGYVAKPDTLDLEDPDFYSRFYGHYDAACVTCHGAPGKDPDPWMIIYPMATLLTDKAVVDQWSDAELYWILENGIKDTGMMALGPTHTEEDIWGVTALVRQLPNMTPEEYEEMGRRYKESQEQQGHGEQGM